MVTRIVFLGTPDFAVPSLERLIGAEDFEVVAVITQPDRPSGRGRKLKEPPVKEIAAGHQIPVYQFERIRRNPEAIGLLDRLVPDLAVVVAFGQILPVEFFNRPPLGTLNVHASVLPAYRGAAPVCHAILRGEKESGVTIMKIDAGMDTGGVLSVRTRPIPEDMTAGDLERLLARDGAELLLETLPGYVSGTIQPVEQEHEKATYAPMISRKDARIDWSQPAEAIHNRVRAMNPWPVAECRWNGDLLKIWRSRVAGRGGTDAAGTIVSVEPTIQVACGDGRLLELLEVQAPGRKRVTGREFVHGVHLSAGEVLT